ncbi:thioredoxin domain-containing protein [Sediminicola luteus]|uniref:Thioredoxin domain-containing protein n=1 Tax=Sediminicola luteus TaxID=319238 RepID=A0A2A4G3K9_9FLAO|nr:thioredoxin domain-containing protein [Sediminicola luteus]PCE62568.1 thioredoxin domain-containing protein [Sediminicola luteus]
MDIRMKNKGLTLLVAVSLMIGCGGNSQKKEEKHAFTNALVSETSPYLLQHAHNPVDWQPWGDKAMDQAKKEGKLLIISIGYASCHWCHVMEEETFEDVAAAEFMNTNFVNIKVDREERPDVDQVYMTALQLISGSGGWPLNVVALPDGRPVYAGTYHTKEQWMSVLGKIQELYQKDPEKVTTSAEALAQGVRDVNVVEPPMDENLLDEKFVTNSVMAWQEQWDQAYGGRKGSQKFMMPATLDFLMDYAELTQDNLAKSFVKTTLDQMAKGGIYDHIGGGFYRYSTDPEWKIPHFEKMLYDNAQLIGLYSKAYKVFGDDNYKNIAYGTLDFLKREMKTPEKGFMAAMDADTDGGEGAFYIWKPEELKTVLGADYEAFAKVYNLNEDQAWEHGSFVLRKTQDAHEKEAEWHQKLLEVRNQRLRPALDDKIIVSWNALLIDGLVEGYKSFGDATFLKEANDIVAFVKALGMENGKLIHSYKKGGKHVAGFSEDYALLAEALLNLYSVTTDESHLELAQDLMAKAETFWEENEGMYRYKEASELISKIIRTDDGVIASPNAVLANNLLQLGHLEYDMDKIGRAKAMLAKMGSTLSANLYNHAKWGQLLLGTAYPYYEIAVVGDDAKSRMNEMHAMHLPNALIIGSESDSKQPLFDQRYVVGETFIYVCQESTCKLPVKTTKEAIAQMRNFSLGF